MLKARSAARAPAREPLASAQTWIASVSHSWMGRDTTLLFVGCVVLALAWARLAIADVSLLVYQDASEQTYAWWQYNVTELQNGRLPLWDPYTFGGRTNIGEGQEAVFYPLFVLSSFVTGQWAGSIAAIQLFAFGHALLAFAGAYLLARIMDCRGLGALACGLVFALGSFFSSRAVAQLNIFDATAWVPFAVAGPFLVARTQQVRWALLSGVALALSVLAGHAQPALHASMVVALTLAWLCVVPIGPGVKAMGARRPLLALLVVAGTAGCLAAIQILPMLEYGPLALRWVGSDEPVVASARIPFEIIAANPSLDLRLLPTAFVRNIQMTDGGLYVGFAASAGAIVGLVLHHSRTRFLWFALGVFGIALAIGTAAPVLRVVYLLPLIDKIREPVRYLLLAHLSLAVLAGMGVDYLARKDLTWRAPGVVLVGAIAIELGVGWASSLPSRAGFNASGNREVQQYYSTPEADGLAEFLATQPGLFRVDLTDSPLPRNYGELLRIPTVGGYRATSPTRIQHFREKLGWFPPDRGPDLLGTRFLVSARPLDGVREVGQAGKLKIYENPRAFPLAWLVGAVQPVEDDEKALAAVAADDFDPVHVVVVTAPATTSLPVPSSGASGSAEITEYSPSVVRITTRTSTASVLVTSQPEYPGWEAEIDGRSAPLLNVDYAFVGVAVPQGEHSIVFDYRPWSVILGAIVSGLSLLAIIGSTVWWTLTRR